MALNRTIVAGVTPIAASDINGLQAAWDAFTPTYTNLTIGNATVVARWLRIGKTALFRLAITGGTTTSATGAVSIGLPAPAHGSGSQEVFGIYFNAGAAAIARLSILPSATSGVTQFGAPLAGVTTFGNGSALQFSGAYELA